jgi:hypothetical protein
VVVVVVVVVVVETLHQWQGRGVSDRLLDGTIMLGPDDILMDQCRADAKDMLCFTA